MTLLRCPILFVLIVPLLAQMTPPQTQKAFTVAAGLEATVWAAEPMVVNPTNIDIDERGRIWYLEAVNYRRHLKNEPDYRKAGDRIVILEDTDGDGRADSKKIFDQNPALRSPLGISVLGNKVIVSQSPDIIVYTKGASDKVIQKETLLTGWRGVDHDHGLHAIVFGHDGRYYFNTGDQGFDVTDKSGRQFVSSRKGPYYAGTVQRMNQDGTEFTVLAHNFRNPYEIALDSFGNIWQSDNDDDGNAWTRFNYVIEGGNYGYWGPGGRSWREDRGTHFHNENPGVIPNLARLGAGSPCGLVIYEGKLLPARYRHMALHAEAGKRQLNTYTLSEDGAGYGLQVENTIGGADTWFRPSDVAVAPDGAVYISDWYDPGVGGHNMKDIARGRIYRLAPSGHKPKPVAVNVDSADGLAAALGSPAQSVRFLAYTKLREQGQSALPLLRKLWSADDPVLRARALWLLAALGAEGRESVDAALQDRDPRFRILALRLMQLYFPKNLVRASRPLWKDASAQVRREIAVLLQHYPVEEAGEALQVLAQQYDGKDRWYLEALGLGMRDKESVMVQRLEEVFPGEWDSRLGQLMWRLRARESLDRLSRAMMNPKLSVEQRIEAMEAAGAQKEERAMVAVAGVVSDESAPEKLREAALRRLAKRLFGEWSNFRSSLPAVAAIQRGLEIRGLQRAALELADEIEDPKYGPSLLRLAKDEALAEDLRILAIQAVGKTRVPAYVPELEALSKKDPLPLRLAAVRALGSAQPPDLEAKFAQLLVSKEPNELRSEALRVMSRSDKGLSAILDLEQRQQLPVELRTLATNAVHQSRNPQIRARANKLLPPIVSRTKTRLPPPRYLAAQQGDVASGKKVYFSKTGADCAGCHALEPGKTLVGPNLSDIGTKLGKEALLDSILNPSAGIAHEYVSWILDTKTQGQVIGILAEDTPQRVVVKNEMGEEIRLRPSEITARRKSNLSMMPEDLVTKMTEQQLVDLLEYLTTLKDAPRAAGR